MILDGKSQSNISGEEASLALWVAELVGQTNKIVKESGNAPDFDASQWVSDWINSPVPALGGQRPIDLMQTPEGRELVASILGMMQSGAYA